MPPGDEVTRPGPSGVAISDDAIGPGEASGRPGWYPLLAEGAGYALFALSPQGVVSSWNVGARHIGGYRDDEVVGRHHSLLYPEAARAAGRPELYLRGALERGTVVVDCWQLRKGGEPYWATLAITALWDVRRRLRGFAEWALDRTDHLRRPGEVARHAERERIGEALADSVVQRLLALGLHLDGLRSLCEGIPEMQALVGDAQRRADEAIVVLRRAIFDGRHA